VLNGFKNTIPKTFIIKEILTKIKAGFKDFGVLMMVVVMTNFN